MFIYFLNYYNMLYKDNALVIDNNTLTALTLLIAESNPKEKDLITALIMTFLPNTLKKSLIYSIILVDLKKEGIYMKIISINAGSSSLKFSLFDMDDKKVIASGLFERIGIDGSSYTIKYNGEKIKTEAELATHTDAVKILLDKLVSLNIIKSLDEIDGVGHRLVHGKDKYKASCLITDEVVNDLIAFKDFAPLHNPANVLGIQAFKEVLPDVPMVGVFDTAFHQTMDEESYLYPVPYSWYKEHGVRKYGFHGTSHRYIAKTISEKLGRDDLRIISCHVGNGGSITAIKDGKCVDTSMGFYSPSRYNDGNTFW